MALTVNIVLPAVVASLLAGTGAVATYATARGTATEISAPAQESVAAAAVPSPLPPAARPCDAQTWPYIDASCTKNAGEERRVRVVSVPRLDDNPAVTRSPVAIPHVPNPQPPVSQPASPSNLQSRDTVLRSPEIVVPPKVSKREKRSEQRRERHERRWAAQSYQVPGDQDGRMRPLIVVRPMRLEAFR